MKMKEESSFSLDNLNVNSFHVTIDKLPFFNYKLKEINIPGMSTQPAIKETPFQVIKAPGDHIDFDVLSFTFIIDEDLSNYISISNWLGGLGFPNTYDEFKSLVNSSISSVKRKSYTQGETSDMVVHLLTNHKNSNIRMVFKNAFPVSLSGFGLNNSNTDSEVITATVDFAFTVMEYQR